MAVFVVVNTSDPDRHEVSIRSTREAAEADAELAHRTHGWEYTVETQPTPKGTP